MRIAAAGALTAGILFGEGVYGLTVVADTTPTLYWVGEMIVGIVVAALAFAWRLRSVTHRAIGAVLTIIVATAFYVTYSMNLIGLL